MDAMTILNEFLQSSNYGYTTGENNIAKEQNRLMDLAYEMNVPVIKLESNLITDDQVYGKEANLATVANYYNQINQMQQQNTYNQGMTR